MNVTNPFLSEGILDVINSGVPRLANLYQSCWPKAGLGHDGKVRVERSADLD